MREMVRSMLYGGLEHLMWPALHGKHRIDVDLVADRYTDLMLSGLQPVSKAERGDHEARLARLEALLDAVPPKRRAKPA